MGLSAGAGGAGNPVGRFHWNPLPGWLAIAEAAAKANSRKTQAIQGRLSDDEFASTESVRPPRHESMRFRESILMHVWHVLLWFTLLLMKSASAKVRWHVA